MCKVVLLLLLQLSDGLLLQVQLVPQIADLFLMDLPVGLDLLLHRFLVKDSHSNSCSLTFPETNVCVRRWYLDFIGRLDLILQPVDFI